MATTPPAPDRRAEAREILRKLREENAPRRARVLQQVDTLRRIRDEQRARRR